MSTAVRFAERMSRLGTEGRSRCSQGRGKLEAKASASSTSRSASPTCDSRQHRRGRIAQCRTATRTTRRRAASLKPRGGRRLCDTHVKAEVDPADVVLVPGSKNVLLFTLLACGSQATRSSARPGYPRVRVPGQLHRRGGRRPLTLREESGFRMD